MIFKTKRNFQKPTVIKTSIKLKIVFQILLLTNP